MLLRSKRDFLLAGELQLAASILAGKQNKLKYVSWCRWDRNFETHWSWNFNSTREALQI